MIFITLKSKILHIIGIVFTIIMFLISILLAIFSAFFHNGGTNTNTSDIFGYNLYIVNSDAFEQIPMNSVAISETVSPTELIPQHIVIYKDFDSDVKKIGIINELYITDGVYSFDLKNEEGKTIKVSEGQIVSKVIYQSELLGDIILFSRSPLGILVIAILPCVAIIIVEIIKFIISRLPSPEVIPIKKNEEANQLQSSSTTIKVGTDGNASYTSAKKPLAPESVQDVLFTRNKVYTKNPDTKPQSQPTTLTQTISPNKSPNIEATIQKNSTVSAAAKNAYAKTNSTVPSTSDKTKITENYQNLKNEIKPTMTSEKINEIEERQKGFFSSRKTKETPFLKNPADINPKQITKPIEKARDLADLEESLVYTHSKKKTETKVHSSDVIAHIRPDSLLKEEDTEMDKKRYSVDDILAGLERK